MSNAWRQGANPWQTPILMGHLLQVGVVPQANGSAVLKCGGTRVLAGVKTELSVPEPEAPGRGKISVSVSCSALASTMFEMRAGEDVSAELTRECDRDFRLIKLVSYCTCGWTLLFGRRAHVDRECEI